MDDTPKMGDDSVVACFGTKVANYWNTDFASIPIEVSELISTYIVQGQVRPPYQCRADRGFWQISPPYSNQGG